MVKNKTLLRASFAEVASATKAEQGYKGQVTKKICENLERLLLAIALCRADFRLLHHFN